MNNNDKKLQRLNLKNKNISDSSNIFQDLLSYSDLIELDISDNNLTKLPRDLSKLSKLQSLDVTNNPFINFDQIAYTLSTLPSLIDLKINLSTQNEAFLILNQLPHLQYLNGKSTRDETHIVDIDDKEIESISLNNEITNFNEFYTKISERFKNVNKDMNKKFFDEFQHLLKSEIENINTAVDNTVPNYIYATNVVSSKLKIIKFFGDKFYEYQEMREPNVSKISRELSDIMFKSSEYLIHIIYKLYPKIDEKTDALRRQLDEALKAAQVVDNEIDGFGDKIVLASKERELIIKQFQEEKMILQEKIDRLEKENKLITDKLLKNAKDIINNNTQNNNISMNTGGLRDSNLKKEDFGYINFKVDESMVKSKLGNNSVIGSTGSKVLTIKMLRDIIDEIYDSKVIFDKKCFENKMPRETMEQHMYTYLNHKYGLKNLIVEWATSIINGIKMYSSEDSDICLFGKILRNELEEDSRLVLQRLKTTISDLLSFFLKSKFPLKSAGEVKDLLNQKIAGQLLEDEWKGIIYYVYENDDAKNLEMRIIEYIKKKGNKIENIQNKKLTREELMILSRSKEEYKINYKEFQKILLDYQIKSRDKYLKIFTSAFKKHDSDNDGIINEDEFIQFLSEMNLYGSDIEENALRLLNIIDPYNNKQITFSETVSLFSSEVIEDEEGQKYSLLDKVCLRDI